MTQVTLTQINNAFLPAKEITDSEKFSGRKEFVNEAYNALLSDGTNIAIVGNRGIGKSSLARQIINIGQGDNGLLEKLQIYHDTKLDYLTIYFACGNSIENTNELLSRLLTTRNCLLEWIYEIPSATKEIGKLSGALEAGIPKIITAKLGSEISAETTTISSVQSHRVETIFQNVITDLLKSKIAKNGILIVVDEFDQIQDTSGFASYLKSLATNTPGLKFCIVGVAQDIQNLMKEHQSSDRLFAGSVINLPSMNDEELTSIIKTAEISINQHIVFDDTAIKKIINLSKGHPYIVHLLGKQTFRTAFLEPRYSIDEDYIENILKSIAEKEADPVLEGRYKKAVASSKQREVVIKAFADSAKVDSEILTSDAYRISEEQGVENASQYVGQLVTDDYGAELIKVRERYYRFRDSLFQTYVSARPPIF
jgi:energy-coupling factor transporter ATP-binding protein EcfA2